MDFMDDGRPMMAHRARTMPAPGARDPNKPRTYFAHGGKVTVDPNAPKPEKAATKAEEETPAADEKDDKRAERKGAAARDRYGKRAVASA